MFGRTAAPETDVSPAETPAPAASRPDLSSFASRRAAKEAGQTNPPRGERIVWVGRDKKLFKNRRNEDVWTDVDLFVDWDHPQRSWYRVVGDTQLEPLFGSDNRRDEVTTIGTARVNALRDGVQPAPPDEIRRNV